MGVFVILGITSMNQYTLCMYVLKYISQFPSQLSITHVHTLRMCYIHIMYSNIVYVKSFEEENFHGSSLKLNM